MKKQSVIDFCSRVMYIFICDLCFRFLFFYNICVKASFSFYNRFICIEKVRAHILLKVVQMAKSTCIGRESRREPFFRLILCEIYAGREHVKEIEPIKNYTYINFDITVYIYKYSKVFDLVFE